MNYDDDKSIRKNIDTLTLGDIGGEDWHIQLMRNKNNKQAFDLLMTSDTYSLYDKEIHEYAVESMAHFCREFLSHYDRILNREAANRQSAFEADLEMIQEEIRASE